MHVLSGPYTEIKYTNTKLLTTEQFVKWLHDNADNISVDLLRVDLDSEKLVEMLSNSKLRIIPSSEGLVSRVKDSGQKTDLSKSSRNFVLHTDGPYYSPPPKLVLLHCEVATLKDNYIPTILKSTTEIIESFSKQEREILQHIHFVYHGRDNKKVSQPLISYDTKQKKWVSYFGGKGHIECVDEIKYDFFTWFEIGHEFVRRINSQETPTLAHNYTKNDLLIFDNHQFLHGRINVSKILDYSRTLNRIWIK